MEEKQEVLKKVYPKFKSQIILPIIFALTLLVGICFLAVKDFIKDLSPIVVWLYFAVSIAYSIIAIYDAIVNKERVKKQKIFILIMCVLSIIASILYAIFFIIAKGR